MVIIFMNLLIGLTVDSIDILKEKSTIIMDVKRIEDIKLGLKFLPRIFRPTKITNMTGKSKTKQVNVWTIHSSRLSNSKVKNISSI